ncbi:MAG: cytochrome c [Bacteroidota bacterium]
MKRDTLLLGFVICLLWACGEPQEPAANTAKMSLPDTVSFSEHIAPIIYQNCTPCHRPGSAGPFSLISYRDVSKRKKMVAKVTRDRYMPPWPADPEYRHFVEEKILSEREIALIDRWAKQGGPIGDESQIPAPPQFPTTSFLGEPDLVLEMEEAFPIKGNNQDRFLFGKIPYEIAQDTFVKAFEFVAGNKKVVHHMNGHLVSYDPEAKANVMEGERFVDRERVPVQRAYPRLGLLNDDGTYPTLTPLVCNYLPGVVPQLYPAGVGGYRLSRKGAFLFNDLHYGPSPEDTSDLSSVNVFFAPGPPERPTLELQMGTLGISDIVPPLVIPPDTVMQFRTEAIIQQDISLLTLNPHMHLLGKSFTAYAIAPTGDSIPLIRIPEWDFRWQYFYTFEYMLPLAKGTRVVVEAIYDNTIDNPNNPFDPPQLIAEREGSMRTTDEMLQFIMTFLPYQAGDEQIALGQK